MLFAAACSASAELAAQFRQRHGLDDGFSGALHWTVRGLMNSDGLWRFSNPSLDYRDLSAV